MGNRQGFPAFCGGDLDRVRGACLSSVSLGFFGLSFFGALFTFYLPSDLFRNLRLGEGHFSRSIGPGGKDRFAEYGRTGSSRKLSRWFERRLCLLFFPSFFRLCLGSGTNRRKDGDGYPDEYLLVHILSVHIALDTLDSFDFA